MLDHCTYDKVKLLHKLSSMLWFIEKHAKNDAKMANDAECAAILQKMSKDLEKYIDELHKTLKK
jgi:hypothetical protein